MDTSEGNYCNGVDPLLAWARDSATTARFANDTLPELQEKDHHRRSVGITSNADWGNTRNRAFCWNAHPEHAAFQLELDPPDESVACPEKLLTFQPRSLPWSKSLMDGLRARLK